MTTNGPRINEPDCGCVECSTGKRNRFFAGKTMKADQFRVEQDYAIQRRRLLTRAIAGWGVVYGLRIDGPRESQSAEFQPEAAAMKATAGLALDRHGREALVLKPATVGANNTFLLDRTGGGCRARSVEGLPQGRYVLAIHYAERRFGDVQISDDCGCAQPEKAFVCETFVFSLRTYGERECPCGEERCRECGCARHERGCSRDARSRAACLCQWTSEAPLEGDSRWCAWNEFELDLLDGIDLACLWIEKAGDRCHPAIIGRLIDDCSPRRTIKNNDLLYDLIRGCDLTRIESISWGQWHRRRKTVPWDEFAAMLNPPDDYSDADDVTRFSVTFTGPVQTHTLREDCFSFTFDMTGEDTGWNQTRVVPITRVVLAPAAEGDPDGTTRTATLCLDAGWIQEVMSRANKFTREGGIGRIEVYGDYILDCRGQPVDANSRGFALRDRGDGAPVAPSGNGTPGGTLVSVFRVGRRHHGGGHVPPTTSSE